MRQNPKRTRRSQRNSGSPAVGADYIRPAYAGTGESTHPQHDRAGRLGVAAESLQRRSRRRVWGYSRQPSIHDRRRGSDDWSFSEHAAAACAGESRSSADSVVERGAPAMEGDEQSRAYAAGEGAGWSEVPGGSPLFQSTLMFETYHLDTELRKQGGAWSNRRFRLFLQTNFPLDLAAYDGAELRLRIDFDRSRIDDAAAATMLGHVRTLLEAMVTNPQQKVGELPLLNSAERHQLLVEWNDTATDDPGRRAAPRVVRGPGRAHARRRGSGVRRSHSELRRARPARQSAGARPAQARRRPGCSWSRCA